MKGLLKLTAIIAAVLLLLLPTKPVQASPTIWAVWFYDCTHKTGTSCDGTNTDAVYALENADQLLNVQYQASYPGADEAYTPRVNGVPSGIYMKLVPTQITRNGHVVNAYHDQTADGTPYAVVTTYNVAKSSWQANMSRMLIEMIQDPWLNNPAGEVCPGTQVPATFNRTTDTYASSGNTWPWLLSPFTVPDIAYTNPVCNFITPTGTYCSDNPSAC